MKTALFAMIAMSSVLSASAFAQGKCSHETVTLAENALKQVTDNYNQGTQNRLSVLKVQSILEDATFCAETVSLKDYCGSKAKTLAEIQTLASTSAEFGMADFTPALIKERIEFERVCN